MHNEISKRMRAGALVILVQDSDEALAVMSAASAAKAFLPVQFASAADQNLIEVLENHKTGEGTLIVRDCLRAYGNNPVAMRLIREIALQSRDGAFSRLILE